MGCLKGESKVKKPKARFQCDKCGAKVKKKDHVCKPVKLQADRDKKTNAQKVSRKKSA